jgi:hypothetical protein
MFLKNGVAHIPADPALHFLTYIAASWFMRLLDEPRETLERWENLEPGPRDDPETGLLRRYGQEKHVGTGTYDRKNTFHFRMSIRKLLAERGGEPCVYETWLALCESLLKESIDAILHFTEELDRQLPGYHFSGQLPEGWDETQPAWNRHALRINQYLRVEADELAQVHNDRSFISFHLADSAPGLEGMVGNTMQPFRVEPGTALIFAGTKAELMTEGRIRAWRHRVRNYKSERLRWSGICFAHTNTAIPYCEKAVA